MNLKNKIGNSKKRRTQFRILRFVLFFYCFETLSENITTNGSYAFCECSSVSSITIPKSIVYIGVYAFYACNNVDEIRFVNTTDCFTTDDGSKWKQGTGGFLKVLIIPRLTQRILAAITQKTTGITNIGLGMLINI